MSSHHPSPEDFSKLEETQKNDAYRVLFEEWNHKGGRIRRLRAKNNANTATRRRGGENRHANQKEIKILIRAFWDLASINPSSKPTGTEIFQVVIDGRMAREQGIQNARERARQRIQQSTATKWRTHLGKAWDKNPPNFKLFSKWAKHFSNPSKYPAPNH